MTYQPDQSQLNALATWYPTDSPLHLDPRHPAIKLAGEAGEILDCFGKHEYKPNFDWMQCKNCSKIHPSTPPGWANMCPEYTPLIMDELGDYSYYLRILAYQKGISFEELCKPYSEVNNKLWYSNDDLLELLSDLYSTSGKVLSSYLETNNIWTGKLTDCALYFLAILDNLDIKLQNVLDLNYKKLNSEPSNHGWRSAKMKTIDDCPPMNPK